MRIQIIVILVFVLAVIVFFIFRNGSKKSHQKVEWFIRLGDRLRLKHHSEKLFLGRLNTLEGNLEGCPVRIFEEIEKINENSTFYTRIYFEPNPFAFEFEISTNRLSTKMGQFFEKESVSFNNPELDKLFHFNTENSSKLNEILDLQAQNLLISIEPLLQGIIISDKERFEYSYVLGFTKEEQILAFEKILEFLRLFIRNYKNNGADPKNLV